MDLGIALTLRSSRDEDAGVEVTPLSIARGTARKRLLLQILESEVPQLIEATLLCARAKEMRVVVWRRHQAGLDEAIVTRLGPLVLLQKS